MSNNLNQTPMGLPAANLYADPSNQEELGSLLFFPSPSETVAPDDSSEPLEVKWSYQSEKSGLGSEPRLHLAGTVACNGIQEFVRRTDPEPSAAKKLDRPVYFVVQPGLYETVDGGQAKQFHDAVADANPGASVLSIASPGVSRHGPAIAPGAPRPTFGELAPGRQRLITQLAGNSAVHMVGVSMGGIPTILTAAANDRANRAGRPSYDIQDITLVSPGVFACEVPDEERYQDHSFVSPEAKKAKALEFAWHILGDAAVSTMIHPRQALRMFRDVGQVASVLGTDRAKLASVIDTYHQILQGVEWATIKDVVDAYGVEVIAGNRDPLREEAQWRAAGANLHVVAGQGHLMQLQAKQVAEKYLARTA